MPFCGGFGERNRDKCPANAGWLSTYPLASPLKGEGNRLVK